MVTEENGIPEKFLLALFYNYGRRFGREPGPKAIVSLPIAISYLRDLTGITREAMARRLCIPVTKLVNLERHGRPVTEEQLQRLRQFAQNACLYNLCEYFDTQAMFKRGSQRKKHEAIEDRHRG